MKAYLIIGNDIDISTIRDLADSFVVGVDKGALFCLNNNIKMDIALGDFDSINEEEIKEVKNNTSVFIRLNPVKDETDTYEAYQRVKDFDEIIILGGIQGKRIEHFLAILNLLRGDKRIKLIDNNSLIYRLDASEEAYSIKKEDYHYISFFAFEDAKITLEGFNYPLTDYHLCRSDSLAISNEISEEEGQVLLKEGKIIVILSKDDKPL